MNKKYEITDAELEIMKILWKNKKANLDTIINNLSQNKPKNKSTIKTLIYRLIEKGTITSKKKQGKNVEYIPLITEKQYQKKVSKNFLNKIYSGSIKSLMLNFVEDQEMTKEDIEELLQEIKK